MPHYRASIRNLCRKEPVEIRCHGKASVIAANKYIEGREDCMMYAKRYFVDRDFDENKDLPESVFVTDGYAIENYYLSDKCVSNILETEFKISQTEHSVNHTKCMDLFKQEHEKFFEGTLLLNAWYSCLYQNPAWNRAEVSLDESFPSEWLDLSIGRITHNYTQADIEAKFHKAPKIDEESVNTRKAELRALGYLRSRGKFEIQFLYAFLSFLKNEPRKNRIYSVAPCSLPFQQNTMVSTFSQYADVSDNLYDYLMTGKRK